MPQHCLFLISLAIALLTGCASAPLDLPAAPTPTPPVVPPLSATQQEQGWWYARYQVAWQPDTSPDFYRDTLLAHRLVAPVLAKHRQALPLWRFHRRAANDGNGHLFSFIFYSDPDTARQIYRELQQDPLLRDLMKAGLILKFIQDDPAIITRPGIADTSDKDWSPIIAETWPYYIMGVSEMWLAMVTQIATDTAAERPKPASMQDLDALYKHVNGQITELWQSQGEHAFLHHLSALYGYEPLAVRF